MNNNKIINTNVIPLCSKTGQRPSASKDQCKSAVKRSYKVTSVFEKNLDSKTTIILNEGGARSSKSHSLCQLFIYKLLKERNKKFLITRKTLPALKVTAYKMFIDLLNEYGLYFPQCHNKTVRTYTLGSNYVLFTSFDEPTKIQSTEFNYIWMEEAEEFTLNDFFVLQTRLSGYCNENEKNQIYLTFNPRNENSYINKKIKFFDDVTLIKSSYKDNPMLTDQYKQLIENLKKQDEKMYKIYALGEYAGFDGLVFPNILCINSYPDKFDEIFYGLDFGFNNPTCLLKICIKDKIIYVHELLYQSKLTNSDLIQKLKTYDIKRGEYIYADSAEPERIQEIKMKGFNIFPADKNVIAGIDFLKTLEIYTNNKNKNFNDELKEYVYQKDSKGNLLDEPVKFNNHSMDALRYALYTHLRKRQTPSFRVI